MALQTLGKTEYDNERFSMDLSDRLATGDTISSIVSMTATPTGLTIATPNADPTNTIVQAKISGGTAFTKYTVHVRVLTENGENFEECGYLEVKECDDEGA